MANIEYSNYLEGLPTAPDPLSGDEIIGASKDGDAVGLTAQQIADLAPPGGGTVTSVSGTTNRIDVDNTDPENPVIDIDAAYDAAVQATADAKVADAINNGTTSVAPSQNAVFDALALKSDQLTSFRRLTASHTLDATDLASVNAGDTLEIEMNVGSANTVTVPLHATQAFPLGTRIKISQYGGGLTSFVATGGVTIRASAGVLSMGGQYTTAELEKVDTDEWYLRNGDPTVISGTWTPTLTNTTNIAASTAYLCTYARLGNTVQVGGRVDIDPTSTGNTVLGITLPVTSAFTTANQAGGCAFSPGIAGQGAAILSDATNDRLTLQYIAVDTTNQAFYFTAIYQVI